MTPGYVTDFFRQNLAIFRENVAGLVYQKGELGDDNGPTGSPWTLPNAAVCGDEVDDVVTVTLQHDPHDVLADVVDVALHRGEQDLALAGRAAVLLRLDEGHQVGHRPFHDPRHVCFMVCVPPGPGQREREYDKGAAEIAGGMDTLRERPFLLSYPEPITPLVFPEEPVDRMFLSADLFMPQVVAPSQQLGATAPVTMAGTVALAVAEGLMSLTIIQLRNPGAPYLMGCNVSGFDMATSTMSIAAPEMSLGLAAQAEVVQSFGLPTWGLAGSTDSKTIDAQAGIESAFSILAQGLAGLNLIHDVGYMDMAMVCSTAQLILGNEAIARGRNLSPAARLAFHQAESGPTMENLHAWLSRQFEDRLVEPNSTQARALMSRARKRRRLETS